MSDFFIFNKKIFRSVAAAEIVLGPNAVKDILDQVILDTVRDPEMRRGIQELLSYDPNKGSHICVTMPQDPKEPPKIRLSEAKGQRVYQGYTLVDLETSIRQALDEDLLGAILQIIQTKYSKELTVDNALELYQAVVKIKGLLTPTKKEGDN